MSILEKQILPPNDQAKWQEVLQLIGSHNNQAKTLAEYQGFLNDFEISKVFTQLAATYGEFSSDYGVSSTMSQQIFENDDPWYGFRMTLNSIANLPSVLKVESLSDGKEAFGAWLPITRDGSLRENGNISVFMGEHRYTYSLNPEVPNETNIGPLRNVIDSLTARALTHLQTSKLEAVENSWPSQQEQLAA